MVVLIATHNRHKGAEIAQILATHGLNVLTLDDLATPVAEPIEDGATLEENAYIKAREIHEQTGLAVIADDTGLEVDALGGAPGVYSARYAGESVTYADNCRKLLDELRAVEAPRTARFRTVICYVDEQRTLFAEGAIDGEILEAPRGEHGFGYDPLFRPAGSDQSFAEMEPADKNAISHRARALAALSTLLAPYLSEPSDVSNG